MKDPDLQAVPIFDSTRLQQRKGNIRPYIPVLNIQHRDVPMDFTCPGFRRLVNNPLNCRRQCRTNLIEADYTGCKPGSGKSINVPSMECIRIAGTFQAVNILINLP